MVYLNMTVQSSKEQNQRAGKNWDNKEKSEVKLKGRIIQIREGYIIRIEYCKVGQKMKRIKGQNRIYQDERGLNRITYTKNKKYTLQKSSCLI